MSRQETATATLPDKPSALIRLALGDLARCEEAPELYEIDLARWHEPSMGGRKCVVCLAGSVMAQTLGVGPTKRMVKHPDRDTDRKLQALSDFSFGEVWTGLMGLRLTKAADKLKNPRRDIKDYQSDPARFRSRHGTPRIRPGKGGTVMRTRPCTKIGCSARMEHEPESTDGFRTWPACWSCPACGTVEDVEPIEQPDTVEEMTEPEYLELDGPMESTRRGEAS